MPRQKHAPTLLHFQKALDLTGNGLLLQDKEGQPLYINQALSTIFGSSQEEIIAEGLKRLFPEESLKKFKKNILPETLRFGIKKDEIEGINSQGEHFPLSISTMCVEENDDKNVGFVTLCRDMSEEIEFRRRRLHSDKLAAVGEMLAEVAHELNNPLTSVVGFSELLLRKRVSPDIKRLLRRISSEAIRTSKIVRNLLSVVRSHQPEKMEVGINGVIQNVLELKTRQLHIDNIRLVRRLSEDKTLPMVLGDYQQLLEVFLNVINNAHQAISSDRGKGTLTIETSSKKDSVVIRISDTGPGIPESVIGKLFQPFFTTKSDGSGLGLNISKKIIQEHGGDITVENGRQRGCTFTISLPIAQESVSIIEAPSEPLALSPQSFDIMVLDDEEVILDLHYHLLTQLGHKPHLFRSVQEALPALKGQTFDLILSDVKMPRMNGRKFYTHLKKHHPEMTQKIIFVTGDTLNKTSHLFFKKHHLNVLYKPFILKQLEEIIHRTLENDINLNDNSSENESESTTYE